MVRYVTTCMLTAGLIAGTPTFAQEEELSGTLSIYGGAIDSQTRAARDWVAEEFASRHPNVEVEVNHMEHEAYKTQIRNFLSANPPDIAAWFSGNRMRPYVDAGLFEDVSDIWTGELDEQMAPGKSAVTLDDRQWGMPYTNYNWGMYYRADIYEELGLEPPQNWEELKSNCQTILDSGRKCFAIGTKFLWPAAGWFDYVNLRTHGYEFHVALTNGEIPWTDERVRETFANWRELIDMGAFIDSHAAYSYQEAIPFITNGDAVEYLMGNFIVPALLDGALSIDQVGLYQFPEITPDIPMAEDAPTEMYAIPSGAENKDLARAFLKFVAEPEIQTKMNSEEYLARLPVNSQSSVASGNLVPEGYAILRDNSPGGIAQFFDRDAPAEIAQVAMEGFQRFMVRPDDLDMILRNIERTRTRIYD